MQVIPVLDLLDGHVVRAVRGERTAYRPIRSTLAPTSEPLPVAHALLAASGARTLYIADLGAILQTGAHVDVLAALRAALPGVELWLDAGYADHASMRALFERIDAVGAIPAGAAPLVPVFGTESLRDPDALRTATRDGLAPILSLDRRAGSLLAAASLEPTSSWWPARVIAMTLDQVGSHAGPDLETFERLRADAPAGTTLIGAGGIRDRADLAAAERSGADAWLVASALHDGRLDRANP